MLAVSSVLALAAGAASAEVVVTYVQPERFSDLPIDQGERERILEQLTAHFNKLGARLPAGQVLRIAVDDIDLAGRMVRTNGVPAMQTIRSAVDWPRIDLRFQVESNGEVLRNGAVQLRDMAYIGNSKRYSSGDPLRFEKHMVDEWFYAVVAPRERTASR
ncbi:DUF3016 domain-containing protein [Massilia sp. Mn16-1_5]|nr:DUF3016 domain-containing protein [Massilia sp. Mn16-1_5]